MWFSPGSIYPVSTYLRGRATRCLFWQWEVNHGGVPWAMHTVHQSSLGPKPEQAKRAKWCACRMRNNTIKRPCLHLRLPAFACTSRFGSPKVCVRVCIGMIIKQFSAFKEEQKSQSLGLSRAWLKPWVTAAGSIVRVSACSELIKSKSLDGRVCTHSDFMPVREGLCTAKAACRYEEVKDLS